MENVRCSPGPGFVSGTYKAKSADHLPQRPKISQYLQIPFLNEPDPAYCILSAIILRIAITWACRLSNIKDNLCVVVAVFVIMHPPLSYVFPIHGFLKASHHSLNIQHVCKLC